MEQNIVINIGIWNALGIIATVVMGAWYAAYRLARVETQLTGLESYLSRLTGRVDQLYTGRTSTVDKSPTSRRKRNARHSARFGEERNLETGILAEKSSNVIDTGRPVGK